MRPLQGKAVINAALPKKNWSGCCEEPQLAALREKNRSGPTHVELRIGTPKGPRCLGRRPAPCHHRRAETVRSGRRGSVASRPGNGFGGQTTGGGP